MDINSNLHLALFSVIQKDIDVFCLFYFGGSNDMSSDMTWFGVVIGKYMAMKYVANDIKPNQININFIKQFW